MARRGLAGDLKGANMVYCWKRDYIKADPQKVGEELMAIEYRDAVSVVNLARKKKKSELHKCFEWDDSIAGEEYRKDQARYIMRMIVCKEDRPTDSGIEVHTYRAFESVRFADPGDEGQACKTMAYVPTREALSDPELRTQIMGRLESTIAEAEETAKTYEYLVPAFGAVRERLASAREAIRR